VKTEKLKRDLEEVGFLRFISDLAVLTSFVGGANPRPAAARLTAERRNTGRFTGAAVAGYSLTSPAFPPAALFTHAVATLPAAPSPPTVQAEQFAPVAIMGPAPGGSMRPLNQSFDL
jgi:hypothetical protein